MVLNPAPTPAGFGSFHSGTGALFANRASPDAEVSPHKTRMKTTNTDSEMAVAIEVFCLEDMARAS